MSQFNRPTILPEKIKARIDKLIGVLHTYGKYDFTLKKYTVDDDRGRIYFYTQEGREYDRGVDVVGYFLDTIYPATTKKEKVEKLNTNPSIKQELKSENISSEQSVQEVVTKIETTEPKVKGKFKTGKAKTISTKIDGIVSEDGFNRQGCIVASVQPHIKEAIRELAAEEKVSVRVYVRKVLNRHVIDMQLRKDEKKPADSKKADRSAYRNSHAINSSAADELPFLPA